MKQFVSLVNKPVTYFLPSVLFGGVIEGNYISFKKDKAGISYYQEHFISTLKIYGHLIIKSQTWFVPLHNHED